MELCSTGTLFYLTASPYSVKVGSAALGSLPVPLEPAFTRCVKFTFEQAVKAQRGRTVTAVYNLFNLGVKWVGW
jgi:hypothetical protein